ncbi:MAG: hypothetical protein Kow0037_10660 [Calditrichia bacterium]
MRKWFVLFITAVFYGQMLSAAGTVQDFYSQTARQLWSENEIAGRKCGFPQVLHAHFQPAFAPELQKQKAGLADLDRIYFSPKGHFKIFYTTSGYEAIPLYDRDSNGLPDFLEFIATAFENAYEREVVQLGFNPPPDSTGQPRKRYPIYCRPLSVYGSTVLDYEIPNLNGLNYATYIEINNDFSFVNYPGVTDPIIRDSLAIAVTAAHEFQHALHSGYRLFGDNQGSFRDLWFIEGTAVTMEEYVCPDVNDYLQYIPSYFRFINYPLDDEDRYSTAYGRALFYLQVSQIHGYSVIRQMWQNYQQPGAVNAISTTLQQIGSSLENELKEHALWIFFSGKRSIPGQYFTDAALFPELPVQDGGGIQSAGNRVLLDSLPRLSMQWYQVEVQTAQQTVLQLKAAGNSSAVDLIGWLVSGSQAQSVNPSQSHILEGNHLGDSLFFAIVNTLKNGSDYNSYELIARSENGEIASVYPQPFKWSEATPYIHFDQLPAGAKVYILDSNGRAVQTLQCKSGAVSVSWDLTNRQGDKVGSGVYIFKAIADNGTKEGKFVVIR